MDRRHALSGAASAGTGGFDRVGMERGGLRPGTKILPAQLGGPKGTQGRARAMAEGSQHDVQIMENQPGFDLNDALVQWRCDLAAQPGIATEDIRELETHLRESFTAFQRGGLS